MVYVVAIAGSPSHPSRTYSILEYATKLLQKQEDGSFQLDADIKERLKQSLDELVEITNRFQLIKPELARVS